MMIKVLLFDVGGVLLHGSLVDALGDFARARGIDPERIYELRTVSMDRMRVGSMGAAELFRMAGIEGSDEELMTAWLPHARTHLRIDADLLANVAAWRALGLRTAMLSNISQLRAPYDREVALYEGFDPVLLSNERGLMKPDPAIYAWALEEIGVSAEQVVFIDDAEENLPPARAIGMHAFRFTTRDALLRDLAVLGIPTPPTG